jgi:membrane-associated phospholipid phosphatase
VNRGGVGAGPPAGGEAAPGAERPGGAVRSRRRAHPARRVVVAAAVLAVALFAVFVWLAAASGPGSGLAAWDQRIADAFIAWRSPGRSHLFWAMTLIGDTPTLAALGFSAVVLIAVWGRRARAALVALGLLIGWAISEGAKAGVGRSRPPAADALIALPGSASMPSGHALTTLVFLGVLVYVAFRWRGGGGLASAGRGAGLAWGALLVATVVAVLIGVSRVYLGVHWLSDVLGGWCLGGAWLAVFLAIVPGESRGAGRRWLGGAERGWRHRVWLFFARRAPARRVVRVVAVVIMAALCVAAVIVSGMADPLVVVL